MLLLPLPPLLLLRSLSPRRASRNRARHQAQKPAPGPPPSGPPVHGPRAQPNSPRPIDREALPRDPVGAGGGEPERGGDQVRRVQSHGRVPGHTLGQDLPARVLPARSHREGGGGHHGSG